MTNNEPSINIGEICFGKLVVPIRQLTATNRYPSGVVSSKDLPVQMGREFDCWMTASQIPALGYAYLHDFVHFMESKGLKGDITWDNKT